MVYVLSIHNKPLMPCSNAIARLLLKSGKAKVKRREPFTIKLTYETTEYTQPLALGVDTGSGTFATAVADENDNILYTSEVKVRNDITDKMIQRAKYRRNRRNRKTRYRKPRWLNRHNSIKSNRFSPTMKSKFDSHIREIEFIKSILPISTIVLETGTFDIHLLKNPTMNRHWGYQKGVNYGFENTKAMVLNRDSYTCQCCKGKHKDSKLEVHHIIFRSNGGSDEQENLITLCHSCHKASHDGKINVKLQGKTKGNLKYATQMNSIRCQLLKYYPDAVETFGYVTKANRLMNNYPKEHFIDSCVIATQGRKFKLKTDVIYIKKCVPEGDYQKTKGVCSEQMLNTRKIAGFKKFDKVKYKGNMYFIKGRITKGAYAILMNIEGEKQIFTNPKTVKLSTCKRVSARKSVLTTSIHLTTYRSGSLLDVA